MSVYPTERTTPFRRHRDFQKHYDQGLLNLFDDLTPEQMADDLFGNRQRTSSRSGILKAEAVQRFAKVLQANGIDDFGNLTDIRLTAAETQIREIPGQGSGISFDYFRMLAGDDSLIKPDRMVQRFIAKAIEAKPDQVTPDPRRGQRFRQRSRSLPHKAPHGHHVIWITRFGNGKAPADEKLDS